LLKRFAKNDARVAALRPTFVNGAPDRWAKFLNGQTDVNQLDAAIAAALEAATAFGVTNRNDVPLAPWMQYNLRLREMRDRLSADLARGQPVDATINAFIQQLAKSGVDQTQVDQLQNQLERLKADRAIKGPGDPWKLGPGDDNTRTYVNVIDADTRRTLRFRLVTSPSDGSSFYLCTTELPLELLVDKAEQLRDSLPPSNDSMIGPSGWEWSSRGRMQHRTTWLRNRASVPDYPTDLVLGTNSHVLKIDDDNPKPSHHPAQQISPLAASKLASLLGCRLPTSDEWRAAYQVSNAAAARDQNLRDVTWDKQYRYAMQQPENVRRDLLPNAGIFLGVPQDRPNALTNNDGKLWFSWVDSGGGRDNDFRHLVGNVAEYACDPASGDYSVIGGSAMSPTDMKIDTAYRIDPGNVSKGYSDVGLRLAFSAPGSEAKRLARLVAGLKYQPPPAR
jgi:hypothetical protein